MTVGILVLPILILAVLALGVLVYFICYKAVINRKLRAEESGAHVPMASVETVIKVVVIIGALVLYGLQNTKVTKLQNDLTDMRIVLTDYIAAMQYDLYEMKERAKKEASMFSEIFYDFGEIDTKEHTVQMNFRVALKSYSAETEIALKYRGKKVSFTNNGDGIFTGSISFPLYEEDWDQGMFSVTESGVTKTEVWEDAPMGSMLFECIPQIVIMSSSFGCGERRNKISVEGELEIGSSEENASTFQSLTFYVKKNNEIVDEIPLNDGHISFDLSYAAEEGDYIIMYVTGVDEYGYLHEKYVSGWNNSETAADISYETFGSPYRIYTPDGKVLTQ